MRTIPAVLIGIMLMAASTNPDRATPPTMSAGTVTLGEVRRASEVDAAADLADSRDTLVVERPAWAREGTRVGVFVLDEDAVTLRRVAVDYGRASATLIQIVSGVSPGDSVVISDMQAWDAFERIRLRSE